MRMDRAQALGALMGDLSSLRNKADFCATEAQNLLENGPSAMGVEMAKVWAELAHFHNLQAQTLIMAVSVDD